MGNWKLVGASAAFAVVLLVGIVALAGTAPSLTESHVENDEMLAAAPPLFYHGSNGNGDTLAADQADIAKIGMLFKEMKGKTDMYLENQTLIAYTKQMIKNKLLAKEIIKRFPDPAPPRALALALDKSFWASLGWRTEPLKERLLTT